ncbi:MAG: hypothetical protein SO369_05250 [Treponema sp.]|nr:hypothetical protein [Treponema sp.]
MNILLVDDDDTILNNWLEYSRTKGKEICEQNNVEIIPCSNATDAEKLLKENNIDFLSVDLRLGNSEIEGNNLIQSVIDYSLRIPTIVITATPGDVIETSNVLRTYKKGEDDDISAILNYLISIYNTGITKLLGRKGILEKNLETFYKNCFLNDLESWIQYGSNDSESTQKALVRYAVNNISQLLDDDCNSYYPEEVYIFKPDVKNISTGSIVKDSLNNYFIILSPACDLVIRKSGDFKTDSIQLVEIESIQIIENEKFSTINSKDLDKTKNKLMKNIWTNNDTLYYHWLPKTLLFEGGVINFRKIKSIGKEELSTYSILNTQVSPCFCKDIISRFSSYYARQGQPEICYKKYMYGEM